MIAPIPPQTAERDLIATLNDRLRQINLALGGAASAGAAGATVVSGKHAMRLGRPVSDYASGSLFVETDRGVSYQVQGGVWTYVGGILRAAFASKPADLGAADAGFVWSVSDYGHLLRWTGTGWEFEDAAGNYIAGFAAAPDGAGWQLCDGTATTYLKITAGVASEAAFTTPNLTGIPGYLKMGAAYTGARNAAVAPTTGVPSAAFGAGAGGTSVATGGVSGHTHVISLAGGDPVANLVMLPYFRR